MATTLLPPVAGYAGIYTGTGWALSAAGVWRNDASPGTNDITTTGTIAALTDGVSGLRYAYGGTAATLTLPFVPATGSSPYTFFHVARYNGAAKHRIFQGKTQNWLSGFHGFPQASTGVAYHNNWLTATEAYDLDQNSWLVSSDRPTNYRANRVDRTITAITGTLADQIVVNTGAVADQTSDWAIAEMIYYPTTLSDADVKAVEAYLYRKYLTPSPPVAGYVGWYIGEGWAASGTSGWRNEASPGTNDITATTGTIASAADASTGLPYVYGDTTTTLTLPFVPASTAAPYTFFHVAKYNGTTRRRIFTGKTANWLSGYWGGSSGVAHHGDWMTASASTEFDQNTWLVCSDRPINFRANRLDKKIYVVTAVADQIVVNTGSYPNESSDWAIAEMLYYPTTLSETEVRAVEAYLYLKYSQPLATPPVKGYAGWYTGDGWAAGVAGVSSGVWRNEATPGRNDIATSNLVASDIVLPTVTSGTLQLRLDASTLADGPVTTWTDESANRRVFSSVNVAPVKSLDGVPGVKFLGTGHVQSDSYTPSFTTTNTLFFVVSGVVGGLLLYKGVNTLAYTANGTKQIWMGDGTTTETSRGLFPTFVGYDCGYSTPASGIAATGRTVVCMSTTSTTEMNHYYNGVQVASTKPNLQFADTGSTLAIGADVNIQDGVTGDVHEVLHYDAALSSTDIVAVSTYLSTKWRRIAAEHDPYTGHSYAYGGTTVTLTLPFVPAASTSPYTFFHVARYNGAAKGRIFQGNTANWWSGFHGGSTGTAHHHVLITAYPSSEFDSNKWLVSAHRPTNYRANLIDKTTDSSRQLAVQIVVNSGTWASEKSDWAISEMIYYTTTLSDADVIKVERYLNEKYKAAPTTALAASGDTSMYDIRAAFPGVKGPYSLLSYLGAHPSVPTAAPVNMVAFRGLNAVIPTHSPVTLYDTGASGSAKATAALTASGLAVSTAGGGTLPLTVNLASYLTNSAYQGAVTYSVSNGREALPTGVTLNAATGVLSVNPATVNTGTSATAYTRTITATNKWGNTSALAATFNFAAAAATSTSTTGVVPAGSGSSFRLQDQTTGLYVNFDGSNNGILDSTGRRFVLVTKADIYNPSGYTVFAIQDQTTSNYVRHAGLVIHLNPYAANNIDFSWRFDTFTGSAGYTIWNYYNAYYLDYTGTDVRIFNTLPARKWVLVP